MKDFFISHSSKDKNTIVEPLVKVLKDVGFSVWYDKDSILAGDDLYKSISQGLKEAYCLILVLTSNFIKSKWVYTELGMFTQQQQQRIIPILYEDLSILTGPLSFVKNLKFIDVTSNTQSDILEQISLSLNETKNKNIDLVAIDQLYNIHKEINNYERYNVGTIGVKLKEYLDFLNNNFDYIPISAKRLICFLAEDVITYYDIPLFSSRSNPKELLEIIIKHNIGNVNIREYFRFFLSEKIDQISPNEITIVNQGLYNILRWFISIKYPYPALFKQLEVIQPTDLTYDDFQEMYYIDTLVMREDLIADITTIYKEWFLYNNYTHIAIKDSQTAKLIGYCAILPVTDETYTKILGGDFKDKEFNKDAIRQYDLPADTYKLYVAGLALHPAYHNTNAFTFLYNAVIDLLLFLAREREIYVSEIIAEASTKQGEKFCKLLNMKKQVTTKYDTDVYTLELIPPEFRVSNVQSRTLYKICAQQYKKNRELLD